MGAADYASSSAPRYSRPKVLLVDMGPGVESAVRAEGFNISSGSFGTPYRVPKSDKYSPVIPNGSLPNFAEQEVVAVDLVPAEDLPGPAGEKVNSDGKVDVWARGSSGVIDPRPRLMKAVRQRADRIYSNGGLFIIFASARYTQDQLLGRWVGYMDKVGDFPYDNWSFLTASNNLLINPDDGHEILVTGNGSRLLSRLLQNHIDDAEFLCTVDVPSYIEDDWITLAKNKYGEPVSGVLTSQESKGTVFVFPQVEDKGRFLTDLLKHVLPDLMPHLFPHAEGARWVQRPEYEIPEIQGLKDQILVVEEEERSRIAKLENAIEIERDKTSYIHELISATGEDLVAAVKRALEVMGFKSVVDVDKEMEKNGDRGPRNEDLQIHDDLPILLVEVKGISNYPADEDALAVGKYLLPRMREWGHFDVGGLSIINHQRHLPALDRDNKMPFRQVILDNAEGQGLGLMTGWDLHKLLRSYLRNGWQPEHVKPLFYGSGRILPVPMHYELVGVVRRFIEKKEIVGIEITGDKLRQGDCIAFELPVEFLEQDVAALEIDNEQVVEASAGSLVGTQTVLSKGQAKDGVRVFRVTQTLS